ncbi:hypothetical protein [Mycolicibacterium palauense]|uniref:hypothetical protein n=1 Tax=Mycolicibacterium palauense TaxID=2034511 RepID=UPI000BFF17F0|nr:hypothetical protein [Mycolicibacterium palauense]
MTINIHIRHVDGGVVYPDATNYGVASNGILHVTVGEDVIYFSPGYWQQFVVDPQTEDPLGIRG